MCRPCVWMTASVVMGAMLAVAAATEPNIDSSEMIREIYVPFEVLELLLEEQPGRVLMSRDEYESLLKAVHKTADLHAPYATTIVSADYVVIVASGRAEFAGTLVFDVAKPGLHVLELEVGHVGVRRAVLDGRGAPIARTDPDRLSLFVDGEGRHELTLDMTAPVETNGAQQVLTFRLPAPPVAHMSITVPGNVEIRSGGSVVSRAFDETAQVTRFEILPQPEKDRFTVNEVDRVSRLEPSSTAGAVSLVMTLNNRFQQARRAVSARGVLVDEITASYERLHATYLMTILHQAVDRFRFHLPDGFEVTDVKSPLLSHWTVNVEEARRILDVVLREPTTEKVVLGLSALKTPSDLTSWALPRLEPLETVSEAVVVGLLLEDRLSLRSLTANKLIPIDASVIMDALPAMIFASEPGAPRLRAVAAYYAPTGSEEFDATGVFEKPSSRFLVTTSVLLMLTEKELHAQAGFALKPVTEPIFFVDVRTPRGWQILGMTDTDGKALPFEIIDAAGDESTSRVRIAFPGGVAPGVQRNIF